MTFSILFVSVLIIFLTILYFRQTKQTSKSKNQKWVASKPHEIDSQDQPIEQVKAEPNLNVKNSIRILPNYVNNPRKNFLNSRGSLTETLTTVSQPEIVSLTNENQITDSHTEKVQDTDKEKEALSQSLPAELTDPKSSNPIHSDTPTPEPKIQLTQTPSSESIEEVVEIDLVDPRSSDGALSRFRSKGFKTEGKLSFQGFRGSISDLGGSQGSLSSSAPKTSPSSAGSERQIAFKKIESLKEGNLQIAFGKGAALVWNLRYFILYQDPQTQKNWLSYFSDPSLTETYGHIELGNCKIYASAKYKKNSFCIKSVLKKPLFSLSGPGWLNSPAAKSHHLLRATAYSCHLRADSLEEMEEWMDLVDSANTKSSSFLIPKQQQQ